MSTPRRNADSHMCCTHTSRPQDPNSVAVRAEGAASDVDFGRFGLTRRGEKAFCQSCKVKVNQVALEPGPSPTTYRAAPRGHP